MRKLFLREHIQDVALILALIYGLQKLPASRFLTETDAGIVPGHDTIEALPQRVLKQRVEFQKTVAVDAGIRCASRLVFRNKFADDLLFEKPGKADRFVWDAQLMAHEGCVVFIPVGAAALWVLALKRGGAVQAHRRAGTVVPCLSHQQSGDRAVHAAAHGDQGAHHVFSACRLS